MTPVKTFKAESTRHPEGVSAHFQVSRKDAVLVYPSGEVLRGPSAKILIVEDILKDPHTAISEIDVKETPFHDVVESIPGGESV